MFGLVIPHKVNRRFLGNAISFHLLYLFYSFDLFVKAANDQAYGIYKGLAYHLLRPRMCKLNADHQKCFFSDLAVYFLKGIKLKKFLFVPDEGHCSGKPAHLVLKPLTFQLWSSE